MTSNVLYSATATITYFDKMYNLQRSSFFCSISVLYNFNTEP